MWWLAAVSLVLLATAAQAAPPRGILATVERVTDGDTLMATSENATTLRIRLLGIDAPETPHRGKPGQPFGLEAGRYLARLVLNRQVRIELFGPDLYRGTRCPAYCRELGDAERWAQRERAGMWAQERYESPAAYRRRNRIS
jgi:endonuclease YncB( thermonuclease family)